MAPKAAKKDELQQKSPAEFFADNKNIAGFDNVRMGGARRHSGAALRPGAALAAGAPPTRGRS
jgi:hypothetical protein